MNDENKKHSSKINIKAIKVGEGNSSDELKKAKIASHGIIAKDKKGEIFEVDAAAAAAWVVVVHQPIREGRSAYGAI